VLQEYQIRYGLEDPKYLQSPPIPLCNSIWRTQLALRRDSNIISLPIAPPKGLRSINHVLNYLFGNGKMKWVEEQCISLGRKIILEGRSWPIGLLSLACRKRILRDSISRPWRIFLGRSLNTQVLTRGPHERFGG